MTWNWEQPGWPEFAYKSNSLADLEQQFLVRSGEFIGAIKHIGPEDQNSLRIELISDEALKTSEIEGEVLNRESVQSSLRQQFGLGGVLATERTSEGRHLLPSDREWRQRRPHSRNRQTHQPSILPGPTPRID